MGTAFSERSRFGLSDVAVYGLDVAGLAMCLTLAFLSMHGHELGGFCADGGPYVIEVHCPQGVPLFLVGGIVGPFGVRRAGAVCLARAPSQPRLELR